MQRDSKPSVSRATSRRQLLRWGAVGTAGLIAGCGGTGGTGDGDRVGGDQTARTIQGGESSETSSGSTDTESSSDGDTTIYDRTYGFNYANVQFNQVNLNPFSPNSDWGLRFQLHQILAKPSPTHSRLLLHTVEDYEFGDNELRVTFKMPWTWSNGDSAGAEDMVVQFELDDNMVPAADRPENPTITGYRADGQETLIVELNEPYNQQAIVYNVLTGFTRLDTYRKGPLAELNTALNEASSESEREDLRQDVVTHTEGMLIGEHPVSGPWKPVNATPSELQMELNTEHWAAVTQGGPLNFRNLIAYNFGDQSSKPAFEAGRLDISGAPLPQGASYPSDVYPVTATEYGGQGICLNWTKDDHFADPMVRQALAYVIDRQQVASNTGGETNAAGARPVSKPIPEMMPAVARQYIPDVWEACKAFEHTDENLELAAGMLEDAGLQRDDGEWYKSNGDRFTIPLTAEQIQVGAMETVAQNFTDFGIESELEVIDGTSLSQRLQSNDWTVYLNTWGEFGFPPLNYRPLYGPAVQGDDGPPAGEGNSPLQLELPPVGDWEGELSTVNTAELLNQIDTADTEEKNKEITRQLAWAAHYTQANYPIYVNSSVTPVRLTDKWIYPPFSTEGDGWVTPDDALVWGCDSPESTLIQGAGGGVRANPDWEGE